jgi:myo-inositol 2-dehydrogenase/D-chiro-inositol 1-dehydrogenase
VTARLGVGLVGAGWIGAFHGESRVAHPRHATGHGRRRRPAAADKLAAELRGRATTDPAELIADPEAEAVVIAAISRFPPT